MCTVSMIGDGWREWRDQFPGRHPWYPINPEGPIWPDTNPAPLPGIPRTFPYISGPTQAEFDALKKEVEELKKLLEAAHKFDAATGQPHCEQADKVAFIKMVADFVGVDLKEVLK